MSGKDLKKQKKNISFNTFVILFIVIVLVFVAAKIVTPGVYERQEVDGRMVVVPNTYSITEKSDLSVLDIFRAIPEGLIGSASIVFLVLLVGGVIEIYNETGAIPTAVAKLVNSGGQKNSALVLAMLYIVFAVLGGFLGWIEASLPFVPLVVPLILALGYDSMTAVALPILGCMMGFAIGPTNPYTILIAHEVAELPIFSGFGYRFICYLVFNTLTLAYLLRYANKVKKDPSKSITLGTDVSDITVDYSDVDTNLTVAHIIALLILVGAFGITLYGMMKLGWGLNHMTAIFIIAGIAAGFLGKMGPSKIVDAMIAGAKGSLSGALVVGVARGVQWMLEQANLLDTIIHGLSGMLEGLPAFAAVIGILLVVMLLNGLVASGSGKAVALMPIMIPLGDLLGISRQMVTLAYQFGDGLTNMMWFTYGTLLIFLSFGKVTINKWYKFLWPLMTLLFVVALALLYIGLMIGYV